MLGLDCEWWGLWSRLVGVPLGSKCPRSWSRLVRHPQAFIPDKTASNGVTAHNKRPGDAGVAGSFGVGLRLLQLVPEHALAKPNCDWSPSSSVVETTHSVDPAAVPSPGAGVCPVVFATLTEWWRPAAHAHPVVARCPCHATIKIKRAGPIPPHIYTPRSFSPQELQLTPLHSTRHTHQALRSHRSAGKFDAKQGPWPMKRSRWGQASG